MTARLAAVVLMLGVAMLTARLSPAQENRRAQVEELMALTGARDVGKQMGTFFAQQFFAAMRGANPSIPDDVFAIVQQVTISLLDERANDLLDRVVPLYEKHFTGAELAELLRFYRTDVGRKTIRVMPLLLQESVPISQAWASSLQPELERRIRARIAAEGYRI